jgi:hypothetical protein
VSAADEARESSLVPVAVGVAAPSFAAVSDIASALRLKSVSSATEPAASTGRTNGLDIQAVMECWDRTLAPPALLYIIVSSGVARPRLVRVA